VQKHAPGLNGITPQIRMGSKRARAESASRASEISRLRRDKEHDGQITQKSVKPPSITIFGFSEIAK